MPHAFGDETEVLKALEFSDELHDSMAYFASTLFSKLRNLIENSQLCTLRKKEPWLLVKDHEVFHCSRKAFLVFCDMYLW